MCHYTAVVISNEIEFFISRNGTRIAYDGFKEVRHEETAIDSWGNVCWIQSLAIYLNLKPNKMSVFENSASNVNIAAKVV